MCCVMPPASPLATRVRRIVSSSDVLPWSTWPMTVTTGGRGSASPTCACCDLGQQRVGIVELRGRRLVAHLLGEDHRRFLVEHLVDRHHRAHLHQRLDDLGSLHRHLVREVGDGDRFGNRDVADDRARLHRRAGGVSARIVVATVASALRTAPAGGGGAAGDVAAQLERATPRRFFLEHLAGRLLRRLVALLAGLRGRTVQRAFGRLGGRLRRRSLRGGGLRGLGSLRGFRCLRFGRRLRGGFLGLDLLLGLALRLRFLLLLDVFLLARDQLLTLLLLGFPRGDFLDRQHRGGSGGAFAGAGRAGAGAVRTAARPGDRRRLFGGRRRGRLAFVTADEHALLAHLDLDRARLAGGIGGLDLGGLLAHQRDALLRIAARRAACAGNRAGVSCPAR